MKQGDPMLAGRAAWVVHGTRALSGVQDTGPSSSFQPAEPGMLSPLLWDGGLLPIDRPDGDIQLTSDSPARAGASPPPTLGSQIPKSGTSQGSQDQATGP